MRLFLAMLPRRSMAMLCRLPAGKGALYGDSEAAPKGEGLATEGPALLAGLALALWPPLLEVDGSARAPSSCVAFAELSPRLLTLSPESTKAFLQQGGLAYELLDIQLPA